MQATLGRTAGITPLGRSCKCAFRQSALSGSSRRAVAGVRSREQSVMVEARGRSGGSGANRQPPPPNGGYRSTSSPQIADRIIAAIPYILPFFAAIQYGRYLFFMYPAVRAAIQPVLPAISLYHSIPFGSFICFFGLYLLVVNNKGLPRFTRFHTMQALLIDVSLALPRLMELVFTPPAAGWGKQLYINSQSGVWVITTLMVLFGIGSALAGVWGRIPFIADAADSQL